MLLVSTSIRNAKFRCIRKSLLLNVIQKPFSSSSSSNPNKKDTTTTSTTTTTSSWIDSNRIPSTIRPYLHLMRADKQVGSMLLLWPCCWGIALATPMYQFPDPIIITKFAVGAVLMRSAGCIINDMWDKDFDKHVERTRLRPLASGQLSMLQASGCLIACLCPSLGILLSMNTKSVLVGLASIPLVIVYPLMKRYTYFPQLVLGLTFNWGVLVGFVEVSSLSLVHALPLYCGGVFWTLVYDTIYGYQDREDDAKLGLKSTSLFIGDRPQSVLGAMSVSMLASIEFAGYTCGLSLPFYAGLGLSGAHLFWQIVSLDITNKINLWQRFTANQHIGALVTASIVAGHF